MQSETDIVLSAIRREIGTLPALKLETGIDYAQLHLILHRLEFEWKAVDKKEDALGRVKYFAKASEALGLGHIDVSVTDADRRSAAKRGVDLDGSALCGCGRVANHKGRCSYRREAAGSDFPASRTRSNHIPAEDISAKEPAWSEAVVEEEVREAVTAAEERPKFVRDDFCLRRCAPPTHHHQCVFYDQDIVEPERTTASTEPEPAESPDDYPEPMAPEIGLSPMGDAAKTGVTVEGDGNVTVGGSIRFNITVNVASYELASWKPDRIAKFFNALAQIVSAGAE